MFFEQYYLIITHPNTVIPVAGITYTQQLLSPGFYWVTVVKFSKNGLALPELIIVSSQHLNLFKYCWILNKIKTLMISE